MIDAYEMLRRKENDIIRVRKEIEALHFVAPMLLEPDEMVLEPDAISGNGAASLESDASIKNPPQEEASPDSAEMSLGIPPKRSRLRDLLGLAAGE